MKQRIKNISSLFLIPMLSLVALSGALRAEANSFSVYISEEAAPQSESDSNEVLSRTPPLEVCMSQSDCSLYDCGSRSCLFTPSSECPSNLGFCGAR